MEIILVTSVIIFLAILFWLTRPDPRLPPFPKYPLPFVGNLFHMKEDSRSQFIAWRKQCGDIFSINIIGTLTIVLNGYDVIKEALVKKAEVLSDRPPIFFDQASSFPTKGLLFSLGPNWKEQRAASLTILRQFGMGKNILALKIQEEVSVYLDYVASKKGKPFDIHKITNISVSNVICSIIFGHRFEYNDKQFHDLINCINTVALENKNVGLINILPWLKYFPGDLFKAKKIANSVQSAQAIIQTLINERSVNKESSVDCENLIQAYTMEKDKKVKSGLSTYMDDGNLLKIVMDLFGAGSETTTTTIYWFVVYMLNFPDVQKKVFNEIKEVIGTERAPTMQDRTNMPYCNAAILETQRLANIVPLALPHLCSEDVILKGYLIPKGAFIVPNLDSVLHDKSIWGEDAKCFNPERFLDANGKLENREEFIPFGIGRRSCLGEAMANMELFIFLSNLLQRFQLLPKGTLPPDCDNYFFGITCSPLSYEVRLVERQ